MRAAACCASASVCACLLASLGHDFARIAIRVRTDRGRLAQAVRSAFRRNGFPLRTHSATVAASVSSGSVIRSTPTWRISIP